MKKLFKSVIQECLRTDPALTPCTQILVASLTATRGGAGFGRHKLQKQRWDKEELITENLPLSIIVVYFFFASKRRKPICKFSYTACCLARLCRNPPRCCLPAAQRDEEEGERGNSGGVTTEGVLFTSGLYKLLSLSPPLFLSHY